MAGLFGNLYDFDKDKKLNTFERAADLFAYDSLNDSMDDDYESESYDDSDLSSDDL